MLFASFINVLLFAHSSSFLSCTTRSSPNGIQLNSCEFTTGWHHHQLPATAPLIDSVQVALLWSVRDLWIFIDADLVLVMWTHVKRQCHALHWLHHSVVIDIFQKLIFALVVTRLDYCNAVLVGPSAYLTRCLQPVLNTAARLVFNMRQSDHITDELINLHWLPVPENIKFKTVVIMYDHGGVPHYLRPFTYVADIPGCLPPLSWHVTW